MCWKCGKETNIEIYRTTTCPACGADLHCCKGCKFYAPGSHFDCHETVDELVADKERANFCDYFKVAENSASETASSNGGGGANAQDKAAAARSAFDALFS